MPVCQHCGSTYEVDASKVLRNVMSEYVDAKTGKMYGVLNEDSEKLKVKDQELVRLDVWQAAKKDEEAKKALEAAKSSAPAGNIQKLVGGTATVGTPAKPVGIQS